VVHYQPIVALADAHVVGHEALVRWNHPTRGLLSPGDFLDVAEDSGLITAIGAQVLDRVCSPLAKRPDLPGAISVNVSAVQLAAPDWLSGVLDTLKRHRVDPDRIVIEVTETATLSLVDSALHALTSLRGLGVGIHLDDFGTGYSSISVLRDLPVTVLAVIAHPDDASFGLGAILDAFVFAGAKVEVLCLTMVKPGRWRVPGRSRCAAWG
jgi:EAL domain-containing protein (putative c-di-GMP-specific phosphodiesterase class I)